MRKARVYASTGSDAPGGSEDRGICKGVVWTAKQDEVGPENCVLGGPIADNPDRDISRHDNAATTIDGATEP